MNYQLTLLILFFFIFNSYSQQEEVLLKGQVLEFENSIPGAHLYNKNTFQGTSSTNEGNFAINVRLNDTLIISHVNYFTVKIAIDQKVLNQFPLIIYMKEKTNQLDTVVIPNHNLTKNLKVDSNSRPRAANRDSIIAEFQRLGNMVSRKDYEIDKIDKEAPTLVNVDPTKGSIGGNITGGIGGSASIEFKFKDVELKREQRTKRNFPKKIIADFGITYFTETLKIPKEKVYHFITYCEERNIMELYKKNEMMRILTILGEESKEYLELKEFNSMD